MVRPPRVGAGKLALPRREFPYRLRNASQAGTDCRDLGRRSPGNEALQASRMGRLMVAVLAAAILFAWIRVDVLSLVGMIVLVALFGPVFAGISLDRSRNGWGIKGRSRRRFSAFSSPLAFNPLRLAPRMERFPNLRNLSLSGPRVTDAGLAHLAGLGQLRLLVLNGTRSHCAGEVQSEASAAQARNRCVRWNRPNSRVTGISNTGGLSATARSMRQPSATAWSARA